MDLGNFDQWANRFRLDGPALNSDPATLNPGMSMFSGSYTDRQPVQNLVPAWLPPYDDQSSVAPAPPPYGSQIQGYNTVCPTQLMLPARSPQNFSQARSVDTSRYYPIGVNSTMSPYTNALPLSYQALGKPELGNCFSSFQYNSSLDAPKEPLRYNKNEPLENEEKSTLPKNTRTSELEVPPLSEPLSILAQHIKHMRIQDLSAYVGRGAWQRRKEDIKEGRVKGPANQFSLYCKTYGPLVGELIKLGFIRNDQSLSLPRYTTRVCSISWHIESPSIRNQYQKWAVTDKEKHTVAFPDYKYNMKPKGRPKRTANIAS